ncbi:MAG: hypothetical protein O3A00_25775 [Planctomycetota bacterium]|nr:hypothetical protein [Planctomycetota bacterium]
MSDRRNTQPRRKPSDRRELDRRDTPRQDAQVDIRFMRAELPGDILFGQLMQASPTGVQLMLDQELSVGERLLIEVRQHDACFNLTGTVKWSESASRAWFRVGCQLAIELNAKQHRTLKRILETAPQTDAMVTGFDEASAESRAACSYQSIGTP